MHRCKWIIWTAGVIREQILVLARASPDLQPIGDPRG